MSGKMASLGQELVDFDRDLGLDDTETSVLPEILVSLGRVGVRFDTFKVKFEGSARVTRSFTFGGLDFLVDENVTSRVEIQNFRLLGTVHLTKLAIFTIAVQGGVTYYQLDGRITGETLGSATEFADVPVPVVGFLAQSRIGKFLIEFDVTGIALDTSDIDGTAVDLQVSVGFTVFKVAAVRVGYRLVNVDGTGEDLELDARLDGFYFGASVQF
jgi:hypothetical protein